MACPNIENTELKNSEIMGIELLRHEIIIKNLKFIKTSLKSIFLPRLFFF